MESVKLDVTATCAHPLELRGQQIRDVDVFTTCPEDVAPQYEKAVSRLRPTNLKKPEHGALKSPREKIRPRKSKLNKPSKNPQKRKPKKNKNQKTLNIKT